MRLGKGSVQHHVENGMRSPLERFAESTVTTARRAQAGAALCIAILLIIGAIWLTLAFGINWFTMGVDLLLVVFALGPFVRACEIYESIKPHSQRPEERQRYLYSQSLYIPGSTREARRRRKQPYE
jgi:fatty acid desaturase